MTKPNTLLKVVSIILIVLSVIAMVLTLIGSTFAGSLVSMLYDLTGVEGGVGAGLLTGTALFVVAILGSVLNLVAGILGVKAQFPGCKALGIIILIFAVISAAMRIYVADGVAMTIVLTILRLVLPVLYVWGAFKGPAAE